MSYEVEFRRNASREFDALNRSDRTEALHKLETTERIGVDGEIKVADIDLPGGRYEVHVLFPPGQSMIITIYASSSSLISVTHIATVNGLDDAQKYRYAQEAAVAIGVLGAIIRITGETP